VGRAAPPPPLLIEHPESRVSKCIEKLARRLMGHDLEPPEIDLATPENLYELMEVAPTASFEDIRRANRRVREIYGPESIIVNGLYTQTRLDQLHRRLDEAYSTLMDGAKRKEYDHQLFPDGVPASHLPGIEPVAVPAEAKPPVERPPMPKLGPETEYTGALLRQIREANGIDLREISERTKIGMTYLQAIEEETFKKLPAAVYVRGFLVEYCKLVDVKPDRVLQTYLERFRAARSTPEEED
jgi:flagellar biosynthesis protein FlhG